MRNISKHYRRFNRRLRSIGAYDILSAYDPRDLWKTADGFDRILRLYLQEYEKARMRPTRYADVDAFVSAYITEENR